MMEFELNDVVKEIQQKNVYYKSFIDNNNMDVGVLYLKPGQDDNQQPHSKDEIYFILQGDGYMKIDGENHQIKENKFYFIPKNSNHKFCENRKEIIAVYFFGC